MEHHTDWVNDIVLVNSGKHSTRNFLKNDSFKLFDFFQYFRHPVMQLSSYGMHQKALVCQH